MPVVRAHPRHGTRGVREHPRKQPFNLFYDTGAFAAPIDQDVRDNEVEIRRELGGPLTQRETLIAEAATAYQRGKDEARAGRFRFGER